MGITTWRRSRTAAISVRNVMELAGSDEAAGEHLKQIFLWRHDRAVTSARAVAGFGGTLAIALTLGAFQTDIKVNAILVLGYVVSFAFLIAGWVLFYSIGALQQEYLSSLHLLDDLRKIRTFLRLYGERG